MGEISGVNPLVCLHHAGKLAHARIHFIKGFNNNIHGIFKGQGGLFFAQLNYVVVAAGVLWAYILFGDKPSIWLWAAIAAIALGLAVMNYSKAKTMRDTEV